MIAVVSPGGGEGRTFVAANLAAVFAQSGSRTLLIDLNFRAPRLHELFCLRNNTGISSLLIHRATGSSPLRDAAGRAFGAADRTQASEPARAAQLAGHARTSGVVP